jgi:hypothetical protein
MARCTGNKPEGGGGWPTRFSRIDWAQVVARLIG